MENLLDSSLVDYVDQLDLNPDNHGLNEAAILDFYLTYGPPQEDERIEKLDVELSEATGRYISDLEISSDGIAGGAQPDRSKPYSSSLTELQRWLPVAQKHLGGAELEAMDSIARYITERFDPQQIELTLQLAKDPESYDAPDARRNLHEMARELSRVTKRDLEAYVTNIATLEHFAYSDFMQAFGDEFDRISLQTYILELKGEQLSSAYAGLVLSASRTINPEKINIALDRLDWIAQRNPEVAFQLTQEYPSILSKVRTAGHVLLDCVNLEDPTNKMNSLIGDKDGPNDIQGYWSYLSTYRSTGVFRPEHIRTLKALNESMGVTYPHACEVEEILCAHLPIDEVVSLVEQSPISLSYTVLGICIRRFAAEGHVEKAYDLIYNNDAYTTPVLSIHNLLAIYEETGEEKAYLEANAGLQSLLRNKTAYEPDDATIHEILARTFVAARRHGHVARAAEAAAAMEPYYTLDRYYDCRAALSLRTHIELDNGNPSAAETYAVLLDEISRDDDKWDSKRTLLQVVRAYMKTGDTDAATKLVQTHFATKSPYIHYLSEALAILNSDEPVSTPRTTPEHP